MYSLNLLVVKGDGPSLMERDWLSKLKPNLFVFYAGNPESDKDVKKIAGSLCRSIQRRTGSSEGS